MAADQLSALPVISLQFIAAVLRVVLALLATHQISTSSKNVDRNIFLKNFHIVLSVWMCVTLIFVQEKI